ncbi:MAG: (p)ppGpp synthetase [Nitrospinae bacterium CG11_big_fil_rev_8_21_14_0_20_45_15]|nr:MAG: (p)ppGpp synthetase [Nitrospinae bacterium CG11_big_fil_rev_8_21_14_0_20_45_15]
MFRSKILKKNHALSFPGGSKSRVNKAGNNVRNKQPSPEDWMVIEEWRAAHRAVLNTFQASLRGRTRSTKIVVAQRHKRKSTIVGKLDRLPEMQLARMDDVAGFRLIFPSINDLCLFRQKFHKAKFKHRLRNEIDKYDYIKCPKQTGYRGIHDVYEYDVNSEVGRPLKGLLVEVQYRTFIQHSWATAVEIIGFITESQPKFEQGDSRYQNAMALCSEIIARSHEDSNGPFPELEDKVLVEEFLEVEKELSLLKTLRSLRAVKEQATVNRNAILIFSKFKKLEIRTYPLATDALRDLFKLEKEMPENDIVLVKADKSEDIRLAFKNYFSDVNDFVKLIEKGCQDLSGKHIIKAQDIK